MTDQNVLGCLARLAMAKNADIQLEQFTVYADLLADVPYPLLQQSCARLAKATTYGYPTVGDIRLMVDLIQREGVERVKALPAPLRDDEDRRTWVRCRECGDDPAAWLPPRWCQGSGKGWVEAVNSTMPISTCGRPHSHAPHSFTERCGCHLASWRQERRMQTYSEDTRKVGGNRMRGV